MKSVFSDAIVIVHLDNGWDKELFNLVFDELKKHNGKWDMIGMFALSLLDTDGEAGLYRR